MIGLFSFLQYISHEMGLSDAEDQLAAPSKEQLEQEKQLLLAFKPVMQKFLHDHTDLQVSALYALQVHCNACSFPKGTSQFCCPNAKYLLSENMTCCSHSESVHRIYNLVALC